MVVTLSTKDARACMRASGYDESSFLDANCNQLSAAGTVYFGLLEDLNIPAGLQLDLKHAMTTLGIKRYVEICTLLAEELLNGLGQLAIPGDASQYRWTLEFQHNPEWMSITHALDYICTSVAESSEVAVRFELQFLLFFERYTFDNDSKAVNDAFDKFRRVNRLCRDYDRKDHSWPGPTIRKFVRDELDRIYTPRHWRYNSTDAKFSSGTTSDTRKPIIDKLKALSHYTPYLYSPLYSLEGGYFGAKPASVPRLIAVPKGMGSRRIIAPEFTVTGWYAQAALGALRRMLDLNGSGMFINEHQQEVNRMLAESGSTNGEWATIDMSAASDSISKCIFLSCLPPAFHDMYINYMSWDVKIPRGKGYEIVPLHTLFTSGNPLTWLTEAIWFLGLGRTGCRLAGIKGYRTKVFAYGDDLIVPSAAYETVCDVLELFGHTVNRRKSYGFGVFRESCGGWYCHGYDVTPTYWPRRIVENTTVDIVSSLCSLQHRLISAGYYVAAERAAAVAQELLPSLTSSEVGSTNSDLWDAQLDEYTSAKYRHTAFVTEWSATEKRLQDPTLAALYEMYTYTEYLREGPFYECGLDKLLKVSSSRFKPLEAYGNPTTKITKR